MSLFKLVKHDLRCGLLRTQYIAAALLAFLPCAELLYHLNMTGNVGTWMDYLLHTFKGGIPENQVSDISLPFGWLLTVGTCLFLNLDYMLYDLTNNGQQVMIRCQSKQNWYISKCIWNLLSTALYFALLALVVWLFVLLTGGVLSAENTEEVSVLLFSMVSAKPMVLTTQQGLLISLILPYLTVAALSMLEMVLCLVVKPILSFLACMSLLVLAVYVDSPVVLGNGAMTIRSSLIASNGQEPIVAIIVAVITLVLCTLVGAIVFKHSDILGNNE